MLEAFLISLEFLASVWRHRIADGCMGMEFLSRNNNVRVIYFTGKFIYCSRQKPMEGDEVCSTLRRVPRIESKCF